MIEDTYERARRVILNEKEPNSSLIRDVSRMDDRELGDSSKLSEIIKRSEEKSNRIMLFNEFLGGCVLDQVINLKPFPKHRKPLIAVSSAKIIDKKFDVIQKLWFDWKGDIESSQSEEIQTSLTKSMNSLVMGYIFVTDKKTKKNFIFGIDFVNGYTTGYISMYSRQEDKEDASRVMQEIVKDSKVNNFYKKAKITPHGKFLKTDNTTIDDVILKDDIKKRIKSGTIDMLNSMDTYRKNKIPIKRGILMEGAPGTGKTLVAKALCNQIDSTFIWVTADDVEFPSDITYIYDLAREVSPTVVLFEDIDYIGKKRAGDRGSYDKITGELLNQLDGVESNEGIITLASSNYPKALDKALRNRPGRFDMRIRFELPDADLREKMFNKFFSESDIKNIDMKKAIERTDGYTGAYIKELVVTATMLAIEDKSTLKDGTAVLKDKYLDSAFDQIEKSRKLDEVVEEDE